MLATARRWRMVVRHIPEPGCYPTVPASPVARRLNDGVELIFYLGATHARVRRERFAPCTVGNGVWVSEAPRTVPPLVIRAGSAAKVTNSFCSVTKWLPANLYWRRARVAHK